MDSGYFQKYIHCLCIYSQKGNHSIAFVSFGANKELINLLMFPEASFTQADPIYIFVVLWDFFLKSKGDSTTIHNELLFNTHTGKRQHALPQDKQPKTGKTWSSFRQTIPCPISFTCSYHVQYIMCTITCPAYAHFTLQLTYYITMY